MECTPLQKPKAKTFTIESRDITYNWTVSKDAYAYIYSDPNEFHKYMMNCISEKFVDGVMPYLDISSEETALGMVYTATLTVIPKGGTHSYVYK